MPSFRDLYKKTVLSAQRLGKKVITAKVRDVYPETMEGRKGKSQDKLVLQLDDEEETRIALNVGNANIMAKYFGEDWSKWKGKKIKVSTQQTEMQGEKCLGLLVTPITK